MLRLVKSAYQNNSFIGLFSCASDRMVLVAPSASPRFMQDATDALGVPIVRVFVNQSNLLGIYCVINSNGVVLPSFAEDAEKKILRSHELNVVTLRNVSPGNNILANDTAAWVSPRVPVEERKSIADALGVEVFTHRFSLPSLASSTVVTNKGLFSSNELTDTELAQLERMFKVKGTLGTTNLGVTFNALGLIANSHGGLVGMQSSGFEVQQVFEALSG